MPNTVVVVGGGITGLTAAYTLQREPDAKIILLESDRVGGKIRTTFEGPFLVEHGPDSIFTAKPAALELISELGLEYEVIEPQQSEFSILSKGKLHTVPRPLVGLISVGSSALEKVGFLSGDAKRRVLREADVPKGSGEDESIASFFRRRFGKRFSMTLAEPMLAGIHAGDPERLSMAALYPSYLGLEQKHGSLSSTQINHSSGKYSGRKPGFVALRSGLEFLPRTLSAKLDRVDVRAGVRALSLSLEPSGLQVQTEEEPIKADAVILALPPAAAAALLAESVPQASEKLSRIRSVSTAVATLVYPRSAFTHELRGNGFLVPTDEPCSVTGCTWSSNKWQGRAPDEFLLLRAFMGRDGGLDVMSHPEAGLLDLAEGALAAILKPQSPPVMRKLHRWPNAMPQYELGHLELMDSIEADLDDWPVWLAGAGYRGSGIPDCIRQGKGAALKVLNQEQVMIR